MKEGSGICSGGTKTVANSARTRKEDHRRNARINLLENPSNLQTAVGSTKPHMGEAYGELEEETPIKEKGKTVPRKAKNGQGNLKNFVEEGIHPRDRKKGVIEEKA